MRVNFSKMHGLGNDFMVVDCITQNVFFSKDMIKRLGNRNTGVGFDQLLLVEAPYDPDIDFNYRIFNVDGTEVEQCGNGARCFASFVRRKGLSNKKNIKVSTKSGKYVLTIQPDKSVKVNMGKPIFEPEKIPFQATKRENTYIIREQGETIFFSVVSMGNPHAVITVKDIKNCNFNKVGKILESHHRFPNKVNVGFMQIISENFIKLRVYERGVGETFACGSGACAAVAIGQANNLLESKVRVELLGGSLDIMKDCSSDSIFLIGETKHVFDGFLNI